MNPLEMFQDLIARVPEFMQPLIVALAGAVPFIEGEGAAALGIVGGIHPVVAIIAGAVGNFACVAVLVILSSRARTALVTRHRAKVQERVLAGGGVESSELTLDPPRTPRQAKFQRAFERYGLPGVCLLGPLVMPTQFTATMLAAAGIDRTRILIWQGVAIVLWTVVIGALIGGIVHAAA